MDRLRNTRSPALKAALLPVALLLSACGSGEAAPTPGKIPEQAREFSAEDKKAALALSMGNVQALSAETSAYDRSLLCSIALESVQAQLSESGQLDTAMINAIDQVRTIYTTRVQQLGAAENKSGSEIAADHQQRVEELSQRSERGQIAIGCLRAMA
jgi:hypothetical protein